jgi:hypothetical protein
MIEIRKSKKGRRVEDMKGICPLKRSFPIRYKYICSYVIQAS